MAAESDALVFFGATGDLPYKQVFPALLSLVRRGEFDGPIIGVAKSGWDLLRLLKRTAAANGAEVQSAVFQFLGEDPPLSWHLTKNQKEQIAREWDTMKDGAGWTAVKTFLSKTTKP
jgi:Glucose-6-phosphate dehydrogenase, NAD binding domain